MLALKRSRWSELKEIQQPYHTLNAELYVRTLKRKQQ
jgi:hypothetical protein